MSKRIARTILRRLDELRVAVQHPFSPQKSSKFPMLDTVLLRRCQVVRPRLSDCGVTVPGGRSR